MLNQLCREALEKNRVVEERTWNQRKPPTSCAFHTPFLPHSQHPPWLPSPLKRLWRVGQGVASPLRVSYPHQWLWDSCAHAIVLSHIDIELAQKEILSLLYAQQENGFIPHLIWNKKNIHWLDRITQSFYPHKDFSPFIQPPVLASAVEAIFLRSQDMSFLRSVLPSLKAYYLYLERARSKGDDGLLEIIISYESGKDRSPEYDEVYGRSTAKSIWPIVKLHIRYYTLGWNEDKIFRHNLFRVKDLLLNCVYAQNLFSLSRLLKLAGEDEPERLSFLSLAERCEGSILGKMYDAQSGFFYSLDSRQGRDKKLEVNTISSFFPLTLPHIQEKQAEGLIRGHLLNPHEYWLPYPLPVVPKSDNSKQKGHVIWRGPQTWVYPNWFIVKGLRKQAQRFNQRGYEEIADHITAKTEELILREGFHDFYDSQTGKGSGISPFSWSTLILDMVEE